MSYRAAMSKLAEAQDRVAKATTGRDLLAAFADAMESARLALRAQGNFIDDQHKIVMIALGALRRDATDADRERAREQLVKHVQQKAQN